MLFSKISLIKEIIFIPEISNTDGYYDQYTIHLQATYILSYIALTHKNQKYHLILYENRKVVVMVFYYAPKKTMTFQKDRRSYNFKFVFLTH